MATKAAQPEPATKVQEAVRLARTIVNAMDKGQAVAVSLRQCERLGDLTGDKFITAYTSRALQPGGVAKSDLKSDVNYLMKRKDAKASGIFRFLSDAQTSGEPLGVQLKRGGKLELPVTKWSVSEAETFVVSARRRVKYTTDQQDFQESVEQAEAFIERVRLRIYRYTSSTLSRLVFEEVPEQVLEATRRKVDSALSELAPQALEKFAVAYQELSGSSAENWTNACLGVRRVLLAFADSVFPAQDELVDGRKVGKRDYVNRLWAYAKNKIESESRRNMVQAELTDLGNRIDAIYETSNKGVHATVTKDEAERIIARTYFLIADLL